MHFDLGAVASTAVFVRFPDAASLCPVAALGRLISMEDCNYAAATSCKGKREAITSVELQIDSLPVHTTHPHHASSHCPVGTGSACIQQLTSPAGAQTNDQTLVPE